MGTSANVVMDSKALATSTPTPSSSRSKMEPVPPMR